MYTSDYGNRPRLLLAYAAPTYASECGRYFRRLGWEVEMVASGAEARELAREYRPDVVVLDDELIDESDWLRNAKLSADNPDLRVILVADQANEQRAQSIGASQAVCRRDGAEALANAVLGKAV
jgi:DNA-binding response OmpR family regulator